MSATKKCKTEVHAAAQLSFLLFCTPSCIMKLQLVFSVRDNILYRLYFFLSCPNSFFCFHFLLFDLYFICPLVYSFLHFFFLYFSLFSCIVFFLSTGLTFILSFSLFRSYFHSILSFTFFLFYIPCSFFFLKVSLFHVGKMFSRLFNTPTFRLS